MDDPMMYQYEISELGKAEDYIKALEAKNIELEKKLEEADRKYTEDVTHMDKKLEIAKDTLERLDKITVLAESAKYIIKEALAAINGEGV